MAECIFCRIARGELDTPLVYQNDRVVVFNDIAPQAPTHLLVVPRRHFDSLKEIDDENLMVQLLTVAREAARQIGLDEYRLVINTGAQAGQAVAHLHLHLLGGRVMGWPPG